MDNKNIHGFITLLPLWILLGNFFFFLKKKIETKTDVAV